MFLFIFKQLIDEFSQITGKEDLNSTVEAIWKEFESKVVEYVRRENNAKLQELIEEYEAVQSQSTGKYNSMAKRSAIWD